MSHPWVHAESSAKRWGGTPDDYLKIHEWFDETKAWCADMRHRAMRHHAEGIFEMEKLFGPYLVNAAGKKVYTRYVGEQHVLEDLGIIPTAKDWLEHMDLESWMAFRKSVVKTRPKTKVGVD